jgi:oligopeptide transport system substrate-binding protein
MICFNLKLLTEASANDTELLPKLLALTSNLVVHRDLGLVTPMRFLCLLLLMLCAACGSSSNSTPIAPDTLVRLSESEARGLDPQMLSDLSSIRIAADQFEGLTRFNAAGEAEAALAESWAASADGLQWRFTLKPNSVFSDDTPIRAEIFVKALARIRDEQSGSPHGALFDIIDRIETAGDRSLIVHLRAPFPQLPTLLAHPAMAALPFHRIEAKGEEWTADRPLVTSGAYRLTDWQLNQRMQLSANPRWYGGKPKTANLVWQPMDNLLSGMRLMLAGGAHISTAYPANRQAWLEQNYPKLVHGSPYLATYYFAFNTRKAPFNDIRVRRALAIAVDRTWIADKMIAAGNEPAWSLLPPTLGGDKAHRPAWADWSKAQRLAEAKRLLKEAGYGAQKPLHFEIRFNSSSEHRRAAVAMASMWREIGVDAALLNSEASLHFDSLKRGDFQMARSGWVADLPAPENFLAIHRSDAGEQNYTGYANPRYDAALDAALNEPDPARRAAKMKAAEAILLDDMPILPLYYYVTRALVHPKVSGWQDNIANVHPSYNLAISK